jgi:hypothetical protein
VESAGIVLVRCDSRDVVGAIELSRAAYRKMVQNLVWATAYNLIAIPVAAGPFVRWRIDLPMSVGAIVMCTSTMREEVPGVPVPTPIDRINCQMVASHPPSKCLRSTVVAKPAKRHLGWRA